MDTSLSARIARGLALLDAKSPEWRKKVNLETLDMHSITCALLEQVFGAYDAGLQVLGLHLFSGYEFGFDIDELDEDEDEQKNRLKWTALTQAWKEALQPEGE